VSLVLDEHPGSGSFSVPRSEAERAAAIRCVYGALKEAPITPQEACTVLMFHWWELPKEARRLVIATDVDELPDGLDGDAVNAAWDEAPPELVRRLWWAWLVYLLREWLEVACERSLDEHARVRVAYRASGLELRHDPRVDLRADRGGLVQRVVVAEQRPPNRSRSKRRRSRGPPAGDEDDPDPDGVDRARRGWSS
jgi:hypothetical protein